LEQVTILPVVETAKTMDELQPGWSNVERRGAMWIRSSCSNPEAMRLDEINVLQASLTYSDELPADPEMEAECGQA